MVDCKHEDQMSVFSLESLLKQHQGCAFAICLSQLNSHSALYELQSMTFSCYHLR